MKKVKSGWDILNQLQNFSQQALPDFDFHLHTKWTDGEDSVIEMYRAAEAVGLKYILFSEHVRATSENWFSNFVDEVHQSKVGQCIALAGMETKVLDFDGALDATDNMLQIVDLVMASVHRFPGESGIVNGGNRNTTHFNEKTIFGDPIITEYKLANAILDNPRVDILGHPFGMVYKRFNLVPTDKMVIDLIKKAAKNQVAFEINTRYHPRLWEWIDWCKKYDAPISLGSNAHNILEVGNIVRQLKKEIDYASY